MNIIVRLPWKRPNETEDNWTTDKDNLLWKYISLHSPKNDSDWSTISNRLNTTINQCKLRASYLYKQQFLKLQNEAMNSLSLSDTNNNNSTSSNNNSGSSNFSSFSNFSNIDSTTPPLPLTRLNQQHIIQPPKYIQVQNQTPFNSIDEAQKFKQCVVKNNFNWIVISNELNIPPDECRLIYHSLDKQQQQQEQIPIPYRPNILNNNTHFNYSNINYDENPITQSELINELIEESEEFD